MVTSLMCQLAIAELQKFPKLPENSSLAQFCIFFPLGYDPSAFAITCKLMFLKVSRHLCFWLLAEVPLLSSTWSVVL